MTGIYGTIFWLCVLLLIIAATSFLFEKIKHEGFGKAIRFVAVVFLGIAIVFVVSWLTGSPYTTGGFAVLAVILTRLWRGGKPSGPAPIDRI